MVRGASRLIVVIGLLGFLVPGMYVDAASSATVPLSTGWSSVNMGPDTPVPPPFFVVRGGPGLVAISQAAGGGNTPNVWVSADGRRWQYRSLDQQSFANVAMLSAPVSGKHGLVMVGTAQGPPSSGHAPVPQGVVWTSSDGLSWQRVPGTGNVFKGATLNSVTTDGRSYVAVGTVQTRPSPTPAATYRATAWISNDGMHWQATAGTGPEFRAAFMNGVAAGGPDFVAVGFASPGGGRPLVSAVWTSADGRSWHRLPLGTAFGSTGGIDRIVSGQHELLALGHDNPALGLQHEFVWTSRDGLHWRRVATDPFGVGHSPPVVTTVSSGFAAMGQYDNAPALWFSANGSRWVLAAGSDIFGGGVTMLIDAVPWRNGLLVIGQRSSPRIVATASTGQALDDTRIAWLWTPGTANAPHPDWAATDPLWFRLRLADLGPGFIPRTGNYGMACQLIPDLRDRTAARFQPAVDERFDRARCERALATLQGSLAYTFNFGYGVSNLYGPEPEVTGLAILTRSVAQSRAAYRWGGGIVISGDLNLNSGIPQPVGNVQMAQGGTLYRVATQGFGTAYAVVWRAGRALGMVEVVGVPDKAGSRAIALARAQWKHWKTAGR